VSVLPVLVRVVYLAAYKAIRETGSHDAMPLPVISACL